MQRMMEVNRAGCLGLYLIQVLLVSLETLLCQNVILQMGLRLLAPGGMQIRCTGKGLPNMSSIIKQFRDVFDWVDANSTGRIIPLEGADVEYDSASEKIEEIESDLKKHIVEQKKLLGITSVMDTLLI
uniref:Uncharacterized protein n=1 Tax=Chenopodium quinoa TaxID=63459 RepID=A0A803MSX8_CHEQI